MTSAASALLAAWGAACVSIAGCTFAGGPALPDRAAGMMRAGSPSPAAAQSSITIGKSTRAEVLAALGPGNAIRFDSGYEVWVYRWPGAQRTSRAATELVILFEPSGIVKKTRVRPGYGPEPK
jgi:hypothetical protein